jgi:hypothetical protein
MKLIIDQEFTKKVRVALLNSRQNVYTSHEMIEILRTLETLPPLEEPKPESEKNA